MGACPSSKCGRVHQYMEELIGPKAVQVLRDKEGYGKRLRGKSGDYWNRALPGAAETKLLENMDALSAR